MSIKNIGVLAFAGAATAAAHGHLHARLHAYGTGSSSSAAAIPTGLPSCWGTCFQEAAVSSPEALCNDEAATNCIKKTCATEDVASYEAWLKKQCSSAPYPVGNNSTVAGPTGTGTTTLPSGYSTSLCTETSTLIYKTSTAYSTYVITHTLSPSAPGGYGSATTNVPVTGAGGYGSGSGSSTPNSPIGGGSGSGEQCSDVTVTETQRTTVTVTAGSGSGYSSSASSAQSSWVQQSSPATYATSSTEGSAEAPSSYVSQAEVSSAWGGAPPAYETASSYVSSAVETATSSAGWGAPPTYETPSSAASEAAPSYAQTSSSSAPSSSSSSPSVGTPNGWKGKRGLNYNYTSDVVESLFQGAYIGWAANWDSEDYGKLPADFPFIPTLHSGESYWTDKFTSDVETALQNGATYIFGQNEPDMASQANQTPEQAVETWKTYVEPFAGRAKLCAPSVTNAAAGSGMGLDWLDQFMALCTDCTIDCVNQHWYDSTGNDVTMFKDQVSAATKYGKPVFVGEFAGVGDDNEISDFLNDVMPWMDSNDSIIGYAYFMVYNGLLVEGDSISPYGQTYCNGN